MRLFIAIDIPDRAKQQLQQLQDPNLGVRWTSPGTMHLTLRFVGEVEKFSQKNQLVDELASIQVPSFEMTIKGLGYFPPRKQPKVVWAGIKQNNTLMKLQKSVEQACRSVGFDPEKRPYKPHITIARVKNVSKKEVNTFFNQHKRVRIEEIPVEEFILYESKLHPDGAIHSPLERFELDPESTDNEA